MRERVDACLVFIVTLVCSAYALPRWADWNQNSRFDLTVAMVDHQTLSIDCCVENTGDYAFFNGHTYSDKAPGLSFLAIPPYLLWKAAAGAPPVAAALERAAAHPAFGATLNPTGTGVRADKLSFAAGLTLASFLVVSVPAALLAVVFFAFLAGFSTSRGARVAVTLTYSLATAAFPYAGVFYAHQLVAALLFTAFVLIFRSAHSLRPAANEPTGRVEGGALRRRGGGRGACEPGVAELRPPVEREGWFSGPTHQRPRWSGSQGERSDAGAAVLAGVLLGYAALSEYPAALIAIVLFAYAAYRWRDPQRLALAVAGAAGPLALGAAYHLAIFDTPWPVGYRYSALWQARHSTGLIGLSYPRWDALWGITGSPFRGLFFLSPVLLLAVPGFASLWRRRMYRAEVVASAAAVGSFFAFNSASNMWWGGHAVGPRYLVPMLPFLSWPLIEFLATGRPAWRRAIFVTLAGLSLLSVWGLSWAGQDFPAERWRFPWRDHAWPQLVAGNLARTVGTLLGLSGWSSLAPLAIVLLLIACVHWSLTRR